MQKTLLLELKIIYESIWNENHFFSLGLFSPQEYLLEELSFILINIITIYCLTNSCLFVDSKLMLSICCSPIIA
jgi:hypothetical protein